MQRLMWGHKSSARLGTFAQGEVWGFKTQGICLFACVGCAPFAGV